MRSDRHDVNRKVTRDTRRNIPSADLTRDFQRDRTSYARGHDRYDRPEAVNEQRKKKSASGKVVKKKKTRKKKRRVFAVILVLLLILAAAAAVAVFAGYRYIDSKVATMNHIDVEYSDFGIDPKVAEDMDGYRNIALLGIDAREGERASDTRTDAVIVVSINKDTKDVQLTSVMRDSYLQMQDIDGNDILDKITHANVFGGPVNTCRALNRALDLNISEFVLIDWKAVADTVDALGGVEMDVQENEVWDLNHWGPETARNTGRKEWKEITSTGKQTLNGVQAATYCRIRKNSGGDPGRTERMRKVVMACIDKLKENPKLAFNIADEVFPGITTNMTTKQLVSLGPTALKMKIKDNYGYPFSYYGGKLSNGIWYAVPATLEENTAHYHEEVFGQKTYDPSNTCKELSQYIISDTGITEGNETN